LIRTLLATALSLAMASTALARTKDDHVTVVADPVVYLAIKDVGSCTGFVAKAFGRKTIITAGHCAEDAVGKKVTIKDSVGRSFPAHPVYYDAIHDLSIWLPDAGIVAEPIASAPLACNEPVKIGDDVSMTGFPADFGKVTTFGKVSAMPSPWNDMWPDVYRINVFGGPGNSGSPVLNKAGHVIAILVGGDPSYIGMSMAVPVSEICHPEVM
jgi:S1-C subfamily serine protease